MNEIRIKGDILIVSVEERSCRSIAGLIDRGLYSRIWFAHSGGEARRMIRDRSFWLILINAPLSDEFGQELASDFCRQTACGILLLVKSDVYEEVCDMVQSEGVIIVSKPVSRQLFHQSIRLGISQAMRLSAWEKERGRLSKKLEESRMLGRAKCILIEQRGISEAEAHHYIEKEAMNHRVSIRDICQEIIRLNE